MGKERNAVEKTIKLLKMFDAGPVTSRMVVKKLGISRMAANRWINILSLYIPIYEAGYDRTNFGRPCIVYKKME